MAAAVLTVAAAQLAAAAPGPVPVAAQQDDDGSGQRAPSRTAAGPVPAGTELAEPVAGTRTVDVSDAGELESALEDAAPGDVIRLAAGTYEPIEITASGTPEAPITLTGPADAVIDAGDDSGYAVHLQEASHWQLAGFSVVGGGKGIVVDGGGSNLLDSLSVGRTGDEAVHFRSSSSGNTIQRSRIHDTGLEQPQYGEGVYVGSAKSNWRKYGLDGGPDLSMDNRILENTFERITAENVDIKEETGGTIVARNDFDGSAISGENYADSVVDVKGFDAQILHNVTTGRSDRLGNIIETHVITEPETSGCGNVIEGNRVEGFEPTGELVAVDRKCD
ncbi:hypothetical protein GCM10017691_62610 [Pseudonocardia petroleophila]